jgi:hypothetical protein
MLDWIDAALDRIRAVLRPHVFDVQAALCGSVASQTCVAGREWEIDVALRAHSPSPSWNEGCHALEDLQRWLRRGIEADIDITGASVVISAPESPAIGIVPWWRLPDGRWRCSLPAAESDNVDPIEHCALICARDSALGRHSAFKDLIRIVKYLTRRWEIEHGRALLNSFTIDVLALNHCTVPFNLSEGIPRLLAAAAGAVTRPLRHPLAARPQSAIADASLVSTLLADAADRAESALMTDDPGKVTQILDLMFGNGAESERGFNNDEQCPRLGHEPQPLWS